MLRAFGHLVATCCDVLGLVGSNLTSFKLEPTTPNMLQHIATRWPNTRNMLRPTMLRYVALTSCDRLAGALPSTFDKNPRSASRDIYLLMTSQCVFALRIPQMFFIQFV